MVRKCRSVQNSTNNVSLASWHVPKVLSIGVHDILERQCRHKDEISGQTKVTQVRKIKEPVSATKILYHGAQYHND